MMESNQNLVKATTPLPHHDEKASGRPCHMLPMPGRSPRLRNPLLVCRRRGDVKLTGRILGHVQMMLQNR